MSAAAHCSAVRHLFAGSDGGGERWAVIGPLIETAKLNGVEPHAWLRNTLEKMVRGHAMSRLDELLPWRAKTSVPKRLEESKLVVGGTAPDRASWGVAVYLCGVPQLP